jgi:hypothetical protein
MAHFAEIKNDIVQRVVVINNNELLVDGVELESKGAEFCQNLFGGEWVQTSYNHNIRKQYAGIGFTYDADADVFVAPQPFPSWTLDSNHDWQPPTPMPAEENKRYMWSEQNLQWVEISN